jgi:transposase
MGRQRLRISAIDRQRLSAWIRAGTTPQRVALRARIVLQAAEGGSARTIAQRLGISPHTVSLWQRRFESDGPDALMRDAPGRGRKATVTINAHARVRILLATPSPARRWTMRALASAMGISRASVHRVLKTGELTLTSDSDVDARTEVARS